MKTSHKNKDLVNFMNSSAVGKFNGFWQSKE